MAEFLFLMHSPPEGGVPDDLWGPYLAGLQSKGVLRGGSAICGGFCARQDGEAPPASPRLSGFIRVEAPSLDAARALLEGNPDYEAGGVVEVRELLVTD